MNRGGDVLRLLLIVSAVSTVMIGCNFTMEPDPGATGFDEANAFDAMVGRAVDAAELGGGGQAGPDSADMHTAPPQTPEDLGDTGGRPDSRARPLPRPSPSPAPRWA